MKCSSNFANMLEFKFQNGFSNSSYVKIVSVFLVIGSAKAAQINFEYYN